MPSTQGTTGRDHNPYCFTNWLCGGGIRPGTTYGPSDTWGYKPLDREHPTQVYDIHATILHLLGIDHEKLTFRHNGIDRRLTDVPVRDPRLAGITVGILTAYRRQAPANSFAFDTLDIELDRQLDGG
jgi:hypothetical protein